LFVPFCTAQANGMHCRPVAEDKNGGGPSYTHTVISFRLIPKFGRNTAELLRKTFKDKHVTFSTKIRFLMRFSFYL